MLFGVHFYCIFVGSFWLFIAFADDILNDIINFNDRKISQQNVQKQMNERFNKIVQSYADLQQLSVFSQ